MSILRFFLTKYKIDIYFLDGIPNLEVTTISDDSSYGPAEESIWLHIKFCPFCGQKLMNTV